MASYFYPGSPGCMVRSRASYPAVQWFETGDANEMGEHAAEVDGQHRRAVLSSKVGLQLLTPGCWVVQGHDADTGARVYSAREFRMLFEPAPDSKISISDKASPPNCGVCGEPIRPGQAFNSITNDHWDCDPVLSVRQLVAAGDAALDKAHLALEQLRGMTRGARRGRRA